MNTTSGTAIRELDRRTNDGIDVRLLWNSQTDHVSVVVEDQRGGVWFDFEVEPVDALAAFRHPFAYAGRDQIEQALAA